MNTLAKNIVTSIAIGTAVTLMVRLLLRPQARQPFVRTTEDLSYLEISPEMLVANNLIDLNTANVSDLRQLGLEQETVERVVENRPFRNKLELVSRKVVTEDDYATIKEKIAIANANEGVKVGTLARRKQ